MIFFKKKPDNRLRLLEVLRLRKAYLRESPAPEETRYFEEAKRRCLACNFKGVCDEALAAGNGAAFGTFCPNIHYIQQLRCDGLRFS